MILSKRLVSILGSASIVAAMAGYACAAGYTQTNLVSNGAVPAAHTDPNLINPWGISFFPGASPFWVSDNNAGFATLYDGAGVNQGLVVEIPSPTDPIDSATVDQDQDGTPSGQVANLFAATGAFPIIIPGLTPGSTINTGPALFIFATEDGTILAWNSPQFVFPFPGLPDPDNDFLFSDDAFIVVDNSTVPTAANGAVYKGLALGTRAGSPFLYATNFRSGNVDVFDSSF
ncbi:MAG TPA: TIGR03118 family protein, partial [Candidatus Acidoferrum sp.]|nr:TIGR03118 family protein [Candidatus Acidoferrum sp.]